MTKEVESKLVFNALDRTAQAFHSVHKRLHKINRSTSRISEGFSKISKTANTAFVGVSAGIGVLTVALGDVIQTGIMFETALTNAVAKFPDGIKKGSKEFDVLKKAAIKAGSITEFSSTQAAKALDFMAMAGFSAKKAIAALPSVIDLASAASLDLGRATDIASDALTMFDMMSDDPEKLASNLQHLNDVLAKTATSQNLDIEMLFETAKFSGPVFSKASQSLETFAAATGILAGGGIKASIAGTALRSSLLRLQAPPKMARDALSKLNIQIADSQGNMRDFFDILGDIGTATQAMGDVEKNTAIKRIFGTEATTAMLTLLGAGTSKLKEYRKMLQSADGAAQNMANTMRNTLGGDIKSFLSALEGIKIGVFDQQNGFLRETMQTMTEFLRINSALINSRINDFLAYIFNNFSDIVKAVKQVSIAVGTLIALNTGLSILSGAVTVLTGAWGAMGFIAGMLKTLASSMTVMTAAQWALNVAMTANPIGLIIAGVTALGVAISGVIYYWKDITEWISNAWEKLKAFTGLITGGISGISNLVNVFSNAFGMLTGNNDQKQFVRPSSDKNGIFSELKTQKAIEIANNPKLLKNNTQKIQVESKIDVSDNTTQVNNIVTENGVPIYTKQSSIPKKRFNTGNTSPLMAGG